jgi:hypothetical protein
MKGKILPLFVLLSCAGASAQERKTPEVKMLTPAECALITKRSDNEFFIKGPVTIGVSTFEESSVSPNGVNYNGIDNFDVINRSCFNGKPS